MASIQLDPAAVNSVRESLALSKLKHKRKTLESQVKAQFDKMEADEQYKQDVMAGKAALESAQVKEAEARAKQQQAQQGSSKQKSPLEGMQENQLRGGQPDQTSSNTEFPQPGPPGQQGQLPGVPGAPPFLMEQQRVSQVAPETNRGWTVPMRTTRNVTSMKPNVLTAGQQAGLVQERAYNQQRIDLERRKTQVATVVDLAGLTGDFGTAAKAAQAWHSGDSKKFYEAMIASGRTLPGQIADARIEASNSLYKLRNAQMGKVGYEIARLKAQTENESLTGLNKIADLYKTRAEIVKLGQEATKASSGSRSDLIGVPSTIGGKLTDEQLAKRTSNLAGEGGLLTSILNVVGDQQIDPNKMAELEMIRVAHFNRGAALVVEKTDEVGAKLKPKLVVLDGVGANLTTWAKAKLAGNEEAASAAAADLHATGLFTENVGEVSAEKGFAVEPIEGYNKDMQAMVVRDWDVQRKGGGNLKAKTDDLLTEVDAALKAAMEQMGSR